MQLTEVDVSTFNRRYHVALGTVRRWSVLYRGDTLCVSSQVGCAVRCPFCASGARGLARGLTPDELWGQVDAVRARGHEVRRVTVSGVGEPLHNHEAVCAFVRRCREARIGPSLTTSGGPRRASRSGSPPLPHNGITSATQEEKNPFRMVPNVRIAPLFACSRRSAGPHACAKKEGPSHTVDAGENVETRSRALRPCIARGVAVHL